MLEPLEKLTIRKATGEDKPRIIEYLILED